jgi:general secretion pathway protein F
MPMFQYKAVTADGELLEQEISCDSEDEIITRIREAGQIPVQITQIREGAVSKLFQFRLRDRAKKIGARGILAFTQELASLLEADIPLDRCLAIMNEIQDDSSGSRLVIDIQQAVRSGLSLSQALAAQKGVFPKFYISMIKTAESSGDLSGGLQRLLEYMERSSALREQVVSAMIYPAVLGVVSILSLVLILTYVVPQFATMFEDMDTALPLATQMVLSASTFVQDWGALLVILLVVVFWTLSQLLNRPEFRRYFDKKMLAMPLIGELIAKLEIARFSRSLGTLLEGGVPLLPSLTTASQVLGNHILVEAVQIGADAVSSGKRLVDPLMATGVFPKLALQMIKVGEETGNLHGMLLKVADVYDREVSLTTQRLLALLEPLMIVVLGVAVAFIVLSVLMGITSVNDIPL